jgi:hypothetical protein
MTPELFAELSERVAAHSRAVDQWFIHSAGRSKAKEEALLALLDGRALAEELLRHVNREAADVILLRIVGFTEVGDAPLQ